MWIGTEDGLNLYNANSIKIYKHDAKDKNSLSNNYIQDICEDTNGNIWIGTATGADRITPNDNKFLHFSKDENGKPFGFKCKAFTDRKGNIWIGCNDGLFKLDQQLLQFKRIVNPYSDTPLGEKLSNFISGFYNDSQGRYWVSTKAGLFLYDDDQKKFIRFDEPPKDENYKRTGILFSQVYEDKNNNLWVGTWGYGVFKILPVQKKLVPVSERTLVLVYTSQELNGHEVFWYPSYGLVSVDENNRQTKISYQNDNPYSPKDDGVSALFTDRQNQLWIGYTQSGVQLISPGNQMIKTYIISPKTGPHRISSVGAILKTNTSLYVGGWYADALCKLTNDFKIEKWWNYLPPGKNKFSSNVGDIYADKNSTLWIATFNGLVNMDEHTGRISIYRYDSSVNIDNRFLKILPDGDSVLWLAGYNNGLSRFSLHTHELQMMSYAGQEKFLWEIVFDKKGNIWCANNNGYLERFDKQKRNFTSFHFDSLTESSIYYDLAYDSAYDNIWVASSSGLMRVDLQNLHAELFTERDGLPTTHVNLLCFDRRHNLWIGTDRGLSVYDQRHNSFKNFYENNGLSTEKIDHSLSVGADGMLYIGADNSIMTMDVEAIDNHTEISPVYITGVIENGNLLQPAKQHGTRVVELPYNHNALSFEFAIADYINPGDNELLYRLEGWDKDFIQTKKGEVNYNKLPPGKYVFSVKGINHNGIRNDKGDSVTIIIHPPFWGTWWFILLVSLVIFTLVVLAVRYISQRNLKDRLLILQNEQAVEKERNRISKDMHDDLGSGLTKIAIMSEVVKRQMHEPEKAKSQLENISASSRELVDNLQDIIWVLNPKNDTLESLAAYIREYSLKFFEPFGTEIRFEYPEKFPPVKLSEETRRNIFLTIKESFNNIAKHAWSNTIKMSILLLRGEIVFSIKDDGKGFDKNTVRQFGNGLVNMQNRIEQIGGKYKIVSEPGKGTETFISVFI